jgi:hypothetical protein
MREMHLISNRPGSHAYKKATAEGADIPNVLDRMWGLWIAYYKLIERHNAITRAQLSRTIL